MIIRVITSHQSHLSIAVKADPNAGNEEQHEDIQNEGKDQHSSNIENEEKEETVLFKSITTVLFNQLRDRKWHKSMKQCKYNVPHLMLYALQHQNE